MSEADKNQGVLKVWSRDPMLVAALITVLANVIIAIGAVGVVLVQGVQLADKHDKQLDSIQEMLIDTGSLRRALDRPMEGWWDYEIEYAQFHGLSWIENEQRAQFTGYGTAVFMYDEGKGHYDILLSYLIANGLDSIVVAARTHGYTAQVGKVIVPGDRIRMDYAGRLGLDLNEMLAGLELPVDSDGNPQQFSAEKAKEPHIVWTVVDDPDDAKDDIEFDREGRITKFYARYEGSLSKGMVVFQRRP
jgi:hypothetical protein